MGLATAAYLNVELEHVPLKVRDDVVGILGGEVVELRLAAGIDRRALVAVERLARRELRTIAGLALEGYAVVQLVVPAHDASRALECSASRLPAGSGDAAGRRGA